MLDSFGIKTVRRPLSIVAEWVDELGVSANQVTVAGFVIGALALPALAFEQYTLALVCIMINRVMDGLDGALARIQGITDAGASSISASTFFSIRWCRLVLCSQTQR